ncbi:hypothetical protein DL95DRAFT_510239 [Leptodontidium sp. 2 PMI_412]|nr:hypothetical protein DL95DRAFT_510239 [Leptodontidium sp. 2 PMI_412]
MLSLSMHMASKYSNKHFYSAPTEWKSLEKRKPGKGVEGYGDTLSRASGSASIPTPHFAFYLTETETPRNSEFTRSTFSPIRTVSSTQPALVVQTSVRTYGTTRAGPRSQGIDTCMRAYEHAAGTGTPTSPLGTYSAMGEKGTRNEENEGQGKHAQGIVRWYFDM